MAPNEDHDPSLGVVLILEIDLHSLGLGNAFASLSEERSQGSRGKFFMKLPPEPPTDDLKIVLVTIGNLRPRKRLKEEPSVLVGEVTDRPSGHRRHTSLLLRIDADGIEDDLFSVPGVKGLLIRLQSWPVFRPWIPASARMPCAS